MNQRRAYVYPKVPLVIGPRTALAWESMVRIMKDDPAHWWTPQTLAETVETELHMKTLTNLIHKAARCGALQYSGRKGFREYQLYGECEVVVVGSELKETVGQMEPVRVNRTDEV